MKFIDSKRIAQELREIADGLDNESIKCLSADFQTKILDSPMFMDQWIPEMDGRKSLILDLFYEKDEGQKI